MGQPMLANLVKKEFQAIAYDTVPAALDAAVRLGAERAGSAAEAAAAGDLVITMLPSSANRRGAFISGPAGSFEGIAAGAALRRHVDDRSRHLATGGGAARGARHPVLDAPVSGGVGGAGSRHLGDHGRRRCRRSRRGAAGTGGDGHATSSMSGRLAPAKSPNCANNLISGTVAVAVSEAFRIGEAFGVDPQILTSVIAKSSGATWVMEHMHPVPGIVDERRVEPAIRTGLHDRPDGQRSRPRGQRCARKARAGRRRAGRPAALPDGLLARPRPQRISRRSTSS